MFRSAWLVFIAFIVYWNVLPAPFVFDDEHAIVINEGIRRFSTSLSPTEQGSPLAGRPLVSLTFAVSYALGGLNVRGYRLGNIAIHAICALLLFLVVSGALAAHPIAQTLRRGPPSAANIAFGVAAIWLVHPLVTEAVDYVSQRTELMMGVFFLSTLYAAQRAGAESRRAWLAVSCSCCAMGMACKETMAAAPIAVFLYDRTFTFGSVRRTVRERWAYYAALCATWLVLAALLRSSPRGDSAGFAGASVSPWTYLLDQSVMIVRYLRLAAWPHGLVLDYGEPFRVSVSDVWPYAVTVATLLAGTAIALVRRPILGFLGGWFFLTLAPTSSVIPISTEVGAERRMYLPLMALVVLFVLGVDAVSRSVVGRAASGAGEKGTTRRTGKAGRARATLNAWPQTIVVLAAGLLLSFATIQRNAEYLSGLALWQSVLDRWPPHARAQRNLAAELKLAGRRGEEIVHLREAVKDVPEIRNLLGLELLSLGRNAEAATELEHFVQEHPRDANALSNLGIALAAMGRNDDALQAFQRAVAVEPGNGLSQANLALHLLERNDFVGAALHAREAVRLTPDAADAHNLLGLALIGQQRIDDAIGEFRASLAIQPQGNDATGYLERTLKAIGRPR